MRKKKCIDIIPFELFHHKSRYASKMTIHKYTEEKNKCWQEKSLTQTYKREDDRRIIKMQNHWDESFSVVAGNKKTFSIVRKDCIVPRYSLIVTHLPPLVDGIGAPPPSCFGAAERPIRSQNLFRHWKKPGLT